MICSIRFDDNQALCLRLLWRGHCHIRRYQSFNAIALTLGHDGETRSDVICRQELNYPAHIEWVFCLVFFFFSACIWDRFYWRSKKIAVPRSYLMDICSQMTASEFEYPAATRGYLSSSGTPLRWHTSTERQHWPFVLERTCRSSFGSLQLQPNHRNFLEFDRILGSAVDVLVHCGQVLSEISSVCGASTQFLLTGKSCSKQQILAHMQGVWLYVGKVIFDFIGMLTS